MLANPQAGTTTKLGQTSIIQALVGDFAAGTTGDLAILTTDASGVSQVQVYLNNGNGTFAAPRISGAGQDATGFSFAPGSTTSADKLLIGNAYGDFLTLTGDGSGNFTVGRSSLTGKPLAVGKTAAGRTFVVQTNPYTGTIQVFYKNASVSPSGSSPFDTTISLTESTGPQ